MMRAPELPLADLLAEQRLLGLMSLGASAPALLGPEHFADFIHGLIFEAIEGRRADGLGANAAALREHFGETDALDEVGGPAYLAQLAHVGGSVAGQFVQRAANRQARAVYACWIRRQIIDALDGTHEGAFDGVGRAA